MVTRLLIVAAVLLATGCEKRSAKYCASHTDDLANCDQLDAPPPEPVACLMDNQCTSPLPRCELKANQCVECLTSADCPTDQQCDPNAGFHCRGCLADKDCPSGSCLPAGTCGDDSTTVYTGGGTDAGTCTFASPCATLTYAMTKVTETRNYLHMTGTFTESVAITTPVEILADGATLMPTGGSITLKLTMAVIKVHGLAIVCTGDQDGVETGGNGTITLDSVDISGCGHEAGIDMKDGKTFVLHSTIHDNPAGGIRSDGKADFVLTNNFIHHNGTPITGMYGGVKLGTDSVREEKIEFNTIVDNAVSGLACTQALPAPNNLIGGNGDILAANVTTCGVTGSLVSDDFAALAFKSSTAPFDYHITAASTAKDTATVTSSVMDDFDHELRPLGAAKDFGADEYKAP